MADWVPGDGMMAENLLDLKRAPSVGLPNKICDFVALLKLQKENDDKITNPVMPSI
jgi:hypothetical protein